MKKILILSANPRGDLSLSQEIQDLKDLLVKNINFDVQIETAISIETLEDRLSRYQPFIVHFCGHGNGNQGLVFVDKEGVEQYLSNEKLTDIFKSYRENVTQCVLFNACYTEIQADAITEYIPYVIGTNREISDDIAYDFSIGFYKGVAEEQSIETCYAWGYLSIKSNLKNAEVVTSIDEINSKSRKVEVINEGAVSSTGKPLEIILKHNQSLESQFASNLSLELEQEFIEEGRRKRYKDNLRNILNSFGQRIIHRKNQIDSFENKQRNTLIDKVQDFWIKGFLKPSLYFNTATDVDQDNPSGQILRPLDNLEVIPFDIEQSYDSVKNTDIPNQISDGQTLLILGEPGSGKTIALLQLAERLVAESRENSKKPIPVVFNLSSWVEKQLSLEEWLIEELRDKYQVPKAWSKPWIERQELTLLLDGLDEVKANHRNACVRSIREFSNTHQATEIVVCCRIKQYEDLVERLLLSSVICIQPLSRKQLLDFLKNVDDSLLGLKTVIEQDSGLFRFATTPLILNMMTWTYHSWSVEQCYEQFQNPEDREFNLFESYIEKNLHRKKIEEQYPRDQVLNWLEWLAKIMVRESKIIFLIEKLQPSLLNNRDKKKYEAISRLSGGLIAGLIIALIFGLPFGRFVGLIEGLVFGLIAGLTGGLIYSLLVGRRFIGQFIGLQQNMMVITLFEHSSLSWQKARSNLRNSLVIGMMFSLIAWMVGSLIFAIITGIFAGLFYSLGKAIKWNEVIHKTSPNQGIWNSAKNAVKYSLMYGLIGWLVMGVFFVLRVDLIEGLIYGLIAGLIIGLNYGFENGGFTCIQHFILRRTLYKHNHIPDNYADFLDYASELLLMKKVGGGYIFYHRMLMEHFDRRN